MNILMNMRYRWKTWIYDIRFIEQILNQTRQVATDLPANPQTPHNLLPSWYRTTGVNYISDLSVATTVDNRQIKGGYLLKKS